MLVQHLPSHGRRCPALLVVENETLLRLQLALHLGSTYDVAAVASADEALRLVSQGASFDLVLCEVTMPEMNAVQLCERLAAMESTLTSRVVLMASGGIASASVQRALEVLPNPCITWPFEIDALADVLERHRARAASAANGA
jgi:CheY-like chemotaxis protein